MRNKRLKYLSVILCLLFLVCSACGTDEEVIALTPSDNTVSVSPAEEEPTAEEEDIVYDVTQLSEEQQNMLAPMDTWIYVPMEYADRGEASQQLTWEDQEYAWFAIWLLLDNYYEFFIEKENGSYGDTLSENLVKECASALFADFDGELTSIPAEDQSVISWMGDGFRVLLGDRGEGEGLAICAWTEHPDGSCTVEVAHVIDNAYEAEFVDTTLRHSFELVPNMYTADEEDPIYTYSIVSMETYHVEDDADGYVLPDSDTRYYDASELSGLSADQLRLARNEIYARHGRMFDSADLQAYFDEQPWYQGTVPASDFDDSVLNQYEKANVETIQSVEAAR